MPVTVVPFLIGIAVIVVGLAVSIALHEIGHLVPAKRFGVRVGQYMIGFGPTLWSKRIGETEYGVKAIPLGGYISMAGMYPPSPEGRAGGGFFNTMVQDARAANDETLDGPDDERTFYRLPVWKRIIVMLGGPVMNLLFAIVLFAVLFSGIGVQQGTTTVAAVSECVLPAGSTQTECTASDPAAPAARAGVLPGDVIRSIDGQDVTTFDQVSDIVRASPDETLIMVVDRDGATETLRIMPMLAERPVYDATGPVVDEDGQPVLEPVGFVGIGPTVDFVREPLWRGPQVAFENIGAVFEIVVQLPVKLYDIALSLINGTERDPDGPLSIVGVGIIGGEVASSDAPILSRVSAMLGLVAAVNIALFVFNLIPLLPLDGGHIVVALWDGIKRAWAKLFNRPPPKPVDATKLVPLTLIVVVVMIGMGALLLLADVINPVQLFN